MILSKENEIKEFAAFLYAQEVESLERYGTKDFFDAMCELYKMKRKAMDRKDYNGYRFMVEAEREYVNIARMAGCFNRES